MITSILNLFNACIDGELIRFTEGGQTHWAIIGIRNHERLMLLVLPLKSPRYCENILGAMKRSASSVRSNTEHCFAYKRAIHDRSAASRACGE